MNVPARFRLLNPLRIIGLLFLIAALQACSTIKLAYNQAPEAIWWYVSDYVDFRDSQRVLVKSELSSFQQWHRRTQLPGYLETLQSVRQRLPEALDAGQACEIYTQVSSRFNALPAYTDKLAPGTLETLSSLDADQLSGMEKRFAKANAKYRDEHVDGSAKAVRDKRLKRAVKRLEMLYGEVSDKQLAVLQARFDQSAFNAAAHYAERVRRQQDTLQTLHALSRSEAAPERTRTALRALIERTLDSTDPKYRQYEEKLRLENCQTMADVHNSATPEQREKAVQRIKGYEQDLTTLLRQS
jgi:Family of unknown function (DUF6279)